MKKIRDWCKAVLAGVGLAVLGCSISGHAAVAFVTVGASGMDKFVPAVTNIATGDSVVWIWESSGNTKHSSTSGTNGSPSGLWGSLTNVMPYTFTNTFNATGTYRYYCGIHFATPFFMTGAVVVATASLPPTVNITNPASGAVLAVPANVTIQASASGNGGTVTNVQFLVDANLLTNKAAAPFFAVTNNLAAGSHTLFAVAANDSGLKSTNTATITVVTPVTVLLSGSQRRTATNFQFSYTANAGLNYIIQRSTNLVSNNWVPVITNLAGSSSVTFTDANAAGNPGFYRVGLLPNP